MCWSGCGTRGYAFARQCFDNTGDVVRGELPGTRAPAGRPR
ncbi:hypothetical protein Pd630_LPD15040 (plasmid) [Rhodococcus opacus PD630]|nr:hypothetical protein Pd630_LPD15040 [Rhodococcus opacus PD630]